MSLMKYSNPIAPNESGLKVAVLRCSPHMLITSIGPWYTTLEVKELVWSNQSESDGNVTLTIFYK